MSLVETLRVAIDADDADAAQQLLTQAEGLADSKEKTPPLLHYAVYVNRPRMIELLLDHGADIEIRDQDRNTTPLRYAIVYARREVIRLLVSRGAELGAIQPQRTTALQVAQDGAAGVFEEYEELPSRQEYGEIVDLLKQLGAK